MIYDKKKSYKIRITYLYFNLLVQNYFEMYYKFLRTVLYGIPYLFMIKKKKNHTIIPNNYYLIGIRLDIKSIIYYLTRKYNI